MGKSSLHHDKHNTTSDQNAWTSRRATPLRLPLRKRYSAPLIFEFRATKFLLPDTSPAFAILWLQNIPDEESIDLTLPIFRGDLKRAELNVLPEEQNGTKVGELNVTVHFYRGLGSWHGGLAKKNADVATVMECLVTARDNGLLGEHGCLVGDSEWLAQRDDKRGRGSHHHHGLHHAHNDEHPASSDSGSDSEGTNGTADGASIDGADGSASIAKADHENASSSKSPSGIINEIKEYKRHKEQLHRRHRGIMQWQGPRTVKWMKSKAEHVGEKIGGIFEHSEREPGVETEV